MRRAASFRSRTPSAQISSFPNYFSDVLHLAQEPVHAAAAEGRRDRRRRHDPRTDRRRHRASSASAPAVHDPAPPGKNAPQIDPKPILDGWKLLEATAVYRAAGVDPFFGPGAKNPTIGQILLMSKQQLTNRVLSDPHVQIYTCGRRDIQAGTDRPPDPRRRSSSSPPRALTPPSPDSTAATPPPAPAASTPPARAAARSTSRKINNIPIAGHQGPARSPTSRSAAC